MGDETGKEMPFTMDATVRIHYKRLRKFVKLIDCLIMDSKIHMIKNSTNEVIKKIIELNSSNEDKSFSNSVTSSWIIVKGNIKNDVLSFVPDKPTLTNIFEEIVYKSVKSVCAKHKKLVKSSELR